MATAFLDEGSEVLDVTPEVEYAVLVQRDFQQLKDSFAGSVMAPFRSTAVTDGELVGGNSLPHIAELADSRLIVVDASCLHPYSVPKILMGSVQKHGIDVVVVGASTMAHSNICNPVAPTVKVSAILDSIMDDCYTSDGTHDGNKLCGDIPLMPVLGAAPVKVSVDCPGDVLVAQHCGSFSSNAVSVAAIPDPKWLDVARAYGGEISEVEDGLHFDVLGKHDGMVVPMASQHANSEFLADGTTSMVVGMVTMSSFLVQNNDVGLCIGFWPSTDWASLPGMAVMTDRVCLPYSSILRYKVSA